MLGLAIPVEFDVLHGCALPRVKVADETSSGCDVLDERRHGHDRSSDAISSDVDVPTDFFEFRHFADERGVFFDSPGNPSNHADTSPTTSGAAWARVSANATYVTADADLKAFPRLTQISLLRRFNNSDRELTAIRGVA